MNNTNNIRDKNRTIIITNQLTQQFIDNQTQEWKKYLLRCMRSLGTFTRNQLETFMILQSSIDLYYGGNGLRSNNNIKRYWNYVQLQDHHLIFNFNDIWEIL
jgi:hypothetical protein